MLNWFLSQTQKQLYTLLSQFIFPQSIYLFVFLLFFAQFAFKLQHIQGHG
jgi:hypothetical protein